MNLQDCVGKTIAFDYPVHGENTLQGKSRRIIEVENVARNGCLITGVEKVNPFLDQYRSFLLHKMENVVVVH